MTANIPRKFPGPSKFKVTVEFEWNTYLVNSRDVRNVVNDYLYMMNAKPIKMDIWKIVNGYAIEQKEEEQEK